MENKKDISQVTGDEFETYWENALQDTYQKIKDRKSGNQPADKQNRKNINLDHYPGDEEFDKLLHKIGLSVDPLLIKSLFRDKIESRIADGYKEILAIVLPEYNIFRDEDEFRTFLEYYLSLWNHLDAEYRASGRKTSEGARTLRKKCINILLSNIKFIRDIDKQHIEPDKLPKDLMRKLIEGDSMIQGIIDLMERKPEEADSKGTDNLLGTLRGVELIIDEIQSDIKKELGICLKH